MNRHLYFIKLKQNRIKGWLSLPDRSKTQSTAQKKTSFQFVPDDAEWPPRFFFILLVALLIYFILISDRLGPLCRNPLFNSFGAQSNLYHRDLWIIEPFRNEGIKSFRKTDETESNIFFSCFFSSCCSSFCLFFLFFNSLTNVLYHLMYQMPIEEDILDIFFAL